MERIFVSPRLGEGGFPVALGGPNGEGRGPWTKPNTRTPDALAVWTWPLGVVGSLLQRPPDRSSLGSNPRPHDIVIVDVLLGLPSEDHTARHVYAIRRENLSAHHPDTVCRLNRQPVRVIPLTSCITLAS